MSDEQVEVNAEGQPGTVSAQTEMLPEQSVADIKPLTITEEAEDIVDQVICSQGWPTDVELENRVAWRQKLVEDTKQKLTQQRVLIRHKYEQALRELATITSRDISIGSIRTMQGVRDKFIITIKSFVYCKPHTWIYLPSNEQLLMVAWRFSSFPKAKSKAIKLQEELEQGICVDSKGKVLSCQWRDDMAEGFGKELIRLPME